MTSGIDRTGALSSALMDLTAEGYPTLDGGGEDLLNRLRAALSSVPGVTAVAVGDIRVTPFDEVYPGVELHATVMDNILTGDFLWQPKFIV